MIIELDKDAIVEVMNRGINSIFTDDVVVTDVKKTLDSWKIVVVRRSSAVPTFPEDAEYQGVGR